MTGDVFYREVKPTRSPRGSIMPPGCGVEELDGRQMLRIPAYVTTVDTPVVVLGFTIVADRRRPDHCRCCPLRGSYRGPRRRDHDLK